MSNKELANKFYEIDKVINDNFHGSHILIKDIKHLGYMSYEIGQFEKENNVKVFNTYYSSIKNSNLFNYVVDFYAEYSER